MLNCAMNFASLKIMCKPTKHFATHFSLHKIVQCSVKWQTGQTMAGTIFTAGTVQWKNVLVGVRGHPSVSLSILSFPTIPLIYPCVTTRLVVVCLMNDESEIDR
jgi:hypothetical protein